MIISQLKLGLPVLQRSWMCFERRAKLIWRMSLSVIWRDFHLKFWSFEIIKSGKIFFVDWHRISKPILFYYEFHFAQLCYLTLHFSSFLSSLYVVSVGKIKQTSDVYAESKWEICIFQVKRSNITLTLSLPKISLVILFIVCHTINI